MSHEPLYSASGVLLFLMGLYSLIVHDHLIKKVIGFNIMGSGIFLLLVSFAERTPHAPDPVPHALVLTGIVVTVSATGFALMLIKRIFSETKKPALDDGGE
ncbi:MAG: cation:proton antiporter subunit C [Alphaproteobacteria bacterium]|uniref:Cation:proton antiporter subunit C n=1 Tax=Candidatus Nitrobium versatile TaxID=2884831 RepID=A0A953M131_9BACT|nr:cation:proton antiporter subunit C [Candidatus Nitrobium versatile]